MDGVTRKVTEPVYVTDSSPRKKLKTQTFSEEHMELVRVFSVRPKRALEDLLPFLCELEWGFFNKTLKAQPTM